MRGSVLRGLNVGRLELETGGTRVEIADLGLKVDWRALGQRRLHVRELSAAAVTVTLAPAAAEETPPAQDEAPFSLPSLPVDIALDQLTLGEFHLLQNGEALPVSLSGRPPPSRPGRTARGCASPACASAMRSDRPS